MKILANKLKLTFPDLKNINLIIQNGYGFNSSVVKTNSNIAFKLGKNSYAQRSYRLEYNSLIKSF